MEDELDKRKEENAGDVDEGCKPRLLPEDDRQAYAKESEYAHDRAGQEADFEVCCLNRSTSGGVGDDSEEGRRQANDDK